MPVNQLTCVLPGGYVDESGFVHREAVLSPLSGREEELLADNNGKDSASRVTELLSRCVKSIGTISPVYEKIASNLLIADRQYLLLRLREVTYGDQVQATIFCPWPGCGRKVDLDFSINDIPVKESEYKGPIYEMELSSDAALTIKREKLRRIRFRLPNGEDQEMISPLLTENEANALAMLLRRCIVSVDSIENPGEELISKLSPSARIEIERQMEAVSPKVELDMQAECPECNREFILPLDLHEFFLGEFKSSLDLLYREVHYLAYYYHWSEKEIMDMSREKRRNYIAILADEIERQNNEVV